MFPTNVRIGTIEHRKGAWQLEARRFGRQRIPSELDHGTSLKARAGDQGIFRFWQGRSVNTSDSTVHVRNDRNKLLSGARLSAAFVLRSNLSS